MTTGRAGEAPVELTPYDKHCIEKNAYLPESVCWQLLENYYKSMSLEAWAAAVPMFVTSNAKFAKSYARLIFRFICDWFEHPDSDHSKKVCILEIGAGHGRFTYLVMRQLLKYEHHWKNLGLPERPFVYVFSDVAESNVATLENHQMFHEWIQAGWLDFATFDANCNSKSIKLRKSNVELETGAPIVAIANYVLDSLLTDAFQIANGTDFKRALISIYSPLEEEDPAHPDIIARMSLGWAWERFNFNPLSEDDASTGTSVANDDVDLNDAPVHVAGNVHTQSVLRSYARMGSSVSFTLPIGAFALIDFLREKSENKLMLIVGDKGYRDCDEFFGERSPHIAIHGSISFMVNLHAIKLYFESLGGFHCSTPYKNTFQVTAYYCCGSKRQFAHSIISFEEECSDMSPTGLLSLQKCLSAPKRTSTINDIVHLLRYSAHDPEIFYSFREELAQTCVSPFLTARSEIDFCLDMKEVFQNWFKLRPADGEDLGDAMGHMCMKMGKLEDALFFFEESDRLCPESRHAATYVNMAACHNALGNIDQAKAVLDKALKLNSDFTPSVVLRQQIAMSEHPIAVALIGSGKWLLRDNIPLIKGNKRVKIKGLYAFDSKAALNIKEQFELKDAVVYVGSQGFTDLLASPEIDGCIVDLPVCLMKSILPLLWQNRKHVLTRTPLCATSAEAASLIKTFQLWSLHHAGLSEFNDAEANESITTALQKCGSRPNAAPGTTASARTDATADTAATGSTATADTAVVAAGSGAVERPLAWHVAAAVRCETAFLKLAGDIKSLGRVLTFSCSHADERLPDTKADIREALLQDALSCISVGRTILGMSVAAVTFKLVLQDLSDDNNPSTDNNRTDGLSNGVAVEPDHTTGNKARTFLPRLVGHVRFRDSGKGRDVAGSTSTGAAATSGDPIPDILGTLFLCKGSVTREVKYHIVCSDSIVDVVQTGACWKVVTRSHLSKHQSESAIQAVGNQSTHENWLYEIHARKGTQSFEPWYSSKAPTAAAFPPTPEQNLNESDLRSLKASVVRKVSSSLQQSLVDTALFEGIVQSVEGGGKTINFVYNKDRQTTTSSW